jgi:hypothetical protein
MAAKLFKAIGRDHDGVDPTFQLSERLCEMELGAQE